MDINNKNAGKKAAIKCKSTKGAIDACKPCSGLYCCEKVLSDDGIIEPPYLTKHDISQIEFLTGINKEQFADEKQNPVTQKIINVMKTTTRNGCIFFNSTTSYCQIYKFRPMDCRLFPLDIELINDKYYWALFKYDRCKITKKDMYSLLKYREEALQILGDELKNYATYPVPRMRKIGYEILSELKN